MFVWDTSFSSTLKRKGLVGYYNKMRQLRLNHMWKLKFFIVDFYDINKCRNKLRFNAKGFAQNIKFMIVCFTSVHPYPDISISTCCKRWYIIQRSRSTYESICWWGWYELDKFHDNVPCWKEGFVRVKQYQANCHATFPSICWSSICRTSGSVGWCGKELYFRRKVKIKYWNWEKTRKGWPATPENPKKTWKTHGKVPGISWIALVQLITCNLLYKRTLKGVKHFVMFWISF